MARSDAADALVFFGATGDLAYKKIFPALQAMIRRGTWTCRSSASPSRAGTLDDLKNRAQDSIAEQDGVDRRRSQAA